MFSRETYFARIFAKNPIFRKPTLFLSKPDFVKITILWKILQQIATPTSGGVKNFSEVFGQKRSKNPVPRDDF